jgi:hypothetical protein
LYSYHLIYTFISHYIYTMLIKKYLLYLEGLVPAVETAH